MTQAQMADRFEGARENAKCWLSSIEEMLEAGWQAAAEAEGWTGPHKDKFGATYFRDDTPEADGATWSCATWQELCEEFGIDEDREACERTIHESVLSVMVRDGWRMPGDATNEGPEEYEILLTTGGPALRIWGELDEHCDPSSAELQMQDWGTPWERFPAPEATLLTFARYFYFGD